MDNTKPLYNRFRNCLINDIKQSEKLKVLGLEDVFVDIVKYCFSGEPFLPPDKARVYLN